MRKTERITKNVKTKTKAIFSPCGCWHCDCLASMCHVYFSCNAFEVQARKLSLTLTLSLSLLALFCCQQWPPPGRVVLCCGSLCLCALSFTFVSLVVVVQVCGARVALSSKNSWFAHCQRQRRDGSRGSARLWQKECVLATVAFRNTRDISHTVLPIPHSNPSTNYPHLWRTFLRVVFNCPLSLPLPLCFTVAFLAVVAGHHRRRITGGTRITVLSCTAKQRERTSERPSAPLTVALSSRFRLKVNFRLSNFYFSL